MKSFELRIIIWLMVIMLILFKELEVRFCLFCVSFLIVVGCGWFKYAFGRFTGINIVCEKFLWVFAWKGLVWGVEF